MEQRTKHIRLNLSEAEKRALEIAAARENLRPAVWIRKLALDAAKHEAVK